MRSPMNLRKTFSMAIVALAAAALASACGSADDELSNDDYEEELQPIFERVNDDVAAFDFSAEGSIADLADLVEDAIDDIDELKSEDSGIQAAQDEFVEVNRRQVEEARNFAEDNEDISFDELFAAEVDSSALLEAGAESDAACIDFQAVLDEKGIDANLDCEDTAG